MNLFCFLIIRIVDKPFCLLIKNFVSTISFFISIYNLRIFSSTSSPNKLVINSTFNNIVFSNNQSILLLSNMRRVKDTLAHAKINTGLVISDSKEGVRDLFPDIVSVLTKLKDGNYIIDFYICLKSPLQILKVFTPDLSDKNIFLEMRGSIGYNEVSTLKINLRADRELVFENIIGSIHASINSLDSDKNLDIIWNKEVLIVITRFVDEDDEDYLIRKLESLNK